MYLCNYSNFAKTSSTLYKNANIFAQFFWRKYFFLILTSVPGQKEHQSWTRKEMKRLERKVSGAKKSFVSSKSVTSGSLRPPHLRQNLATHLEPIPKSSCKFCKIVARFTRVLFLKSYVHI
jgi:hypothetical protein